MDAKSQVDRYLTLGRGRVQPPSRQVERVSRFEDGVDVGFPSGRGGHRIPTIGPWLVPQRGVENRFVDDPSLRAFDLEDEDVVDVVVVVKTLILRRRDVGVRLDRVREFGTEQGREITDRSPRSLECLENQGCAVVELAPQGRVIELVRNRGPHTGRPGE